MIHLWYIYLHLGDFVRAHVGVHIPAPWFAYGINTNTEFRSSCSTGRRITGFGLGMPSK